MTHKPPKQPPAPHNHEKPKDDNHNNRNHSDHLKCHNKHHNPQISKMLDQHNKHNNRSLVNDSNKYPFSCRKITEKNPPSPSEDSLHGGDLQTAQRCSCVGMESPTIQYRWWTIVLFPPKHALGANPRTSRTKRCTTSTTTSSATPWWCNPPTSPTTSTCLALPRPPAIGALGTHQQKPGGPQ